MKLRWILLVVCAAFFGLAGIFAAIAAGSSVATAPVYVPDTSHANEPMPDGVLDWNSLALATNLPDGTAQAHFLFTFTNVAAQINRTLVTNKIVSFHAVAQTNFVSPRNKTTFTTSAVISTNIVWVTNSVTPTSVTILDVHPSCGCTTAELPSRPWTIPAGGSGQIPVTVNVEGKNGTLFKSVQISTDKGSKTLFLQITMMPPVVRNMTDVERAQNVRIAKINRMAVFQGDCASCHVKNGEGKYSEALFMADCAICHQAERRASFVPDLRNLKVPTNQDFWRTWIAHGKPGSFMPAFSQSDGGPLTDMQIASLAAYLDQAFPSKVPPAPQ